MLLALILACHGDNEDSGGFEVVARDAGEALAMGTGYDLSTPQAAYFAALHATPDLDARWTFPSSNIPLFVWEEVLLPENVSDPGSCPYLIASGSTTTWETNCRSQEGYNWRGEVVRTVWDEEGLGEWQHYEFAIEVSSDEERRVFDRVSMEGQLFFLNGNDDPVVRYGQTNVAIEMTGYWANGFEPELEDAWSRFVMTGTWETLADPDGELHRFDAALDLGTYGGFTIRGEPVRQQNSCIAEPQGRVELQGQQSATLNFEGANRCDGCAEFYLDGVRATNACRGY